MRIKERSDNTCGAHNEECTHWCERCQMWECDQCHNTCEKEYNNRPEVKELMRKRREGYDENRRNFMERVKARESL
jgi:hypothetical protein